MPNRIIKDTMYASEKVARMSDFQFRLWTSLITYVNDYGIGDGRPAQIRCTCFPRLPEITEDRIQDALQGLSSIGAIECYQVDGLPFLRILDWKAHIDRIRAKKSSFPLSDGTYPEKDTFNPNLGLTVTCQSNDSQMTVKCQSYDSQMTVTSQDDAVVPPDSPLSSSVPLVSPEPSRTRIDNNINIVPNKLTDNMQLIGTKDEDIYPPPVSVTDSHKLLSNDKLHPPNPPPAYKDDGMDRFTSKMETVPDNAVVYAEQAGIRMTSNQYVKLADFLEQDHLPDALVIHAIDVTVAFGSPRFGYLEKILDRYVMEGVTTVEAAEQSDQQFIHDRRQSHAAVNGRRTAAPSAASMVTSEDQQRYRDFFDKQYGQ